MSEDDAVNYEHIQSGTYRIYNTKSRGFVSFPNGNSNIEARFSSRVESDNIKWVVTKKGNSYTIQNVVTGAYACAHPRPESEDEVRAGDREYEWDIRRSDVSREYTIGPKAVFLYWGFDKNASEPVVRLVAYDVPKWNEAWSFRLVRDSPTDPIRPPPREPDQEPKYVFSMDIGTKASSVSFLGAKKKYHAIRNWPYKLTSAEPKRDTSITVPTVIYYQGTNPQLYGGVPRGTNKEDYQCVEEFKRLVHRLPNNPTSNLERTPLTGGLSISLVYQHWITYLFRQIETEYRNQGNFSEEDWKDRVLIFTIPNGWTASEHALLEEAIISSRCVESESKIHFVSESDAILHYMLHKNQSKLQDSQEFMVCDAGGSTINVALYTIATLDPLAITEKAQYPQISTEAPLSTAWEEHSGGIIISNASRLMNFSEEAPSMTRLESEIKMVTDAIDKLGKDNHPKLLILEGGFCTIDYVADKIRDYYEVQGIKVMRPDPSKKGIVAEGALHYYFSPKIVAYAASSYFGCSVWEKYNENTVGIKGRTVHLLNGEKFVQNRWSPIVRYGELLNKGTKRTMSYSKLYSSKYEDLSKVAIKLYSATKEADLNWVCDSEGRLMPGFRVITKICANLSALEQRLPQVIGPNGFPHYELKFRVEIDFSTINLEASIIWNDDGKENRYTTTFQPTSGDMREWKRTDDDSSSSSEEEDDD